MTRSDRAIVHMDMDTFFVSVERLYQPKLIGRPVMIGGMNRGVVAACSYETRVYGVHSAMPMKMAMQLCPDAIILRGDTDKYSYYSNVVTDMIKEEVPLFEKTSIDEFYIDLSGMDRFFGCYKMAGELRQKIMKETGLPISLGLSTSKTVSKVGTNEAKPNGQKEIPAGTEKAFLAPLSIKKIPMVGEKSYKLLRDMGIEKVRTLQQMPMHLLDDLMGANGIVLWQKAQGIDDSPVVPHAERKSMSTEQTFGSDTTDIAFMKAMLVSMTEKLAFQLREEQKLTACVTVKIRYTDFDTHTLQARISYSCSDHVLISKVKALFDRLYQRRMMVRLIGVRFSHLVYGGYQISLFEDTEEMINLYQAMDRMRKRFGSQSVQRAAGMDIQHRDFNPFNGLSSSKLKKEIDPARA